jgi:hypothetical protein
MAWVSMRRSVPCVLRYHGHAANDPDFQATDPAARWPRHARRWVAVFLLLAAVTAFSLSRGDASNPTTHEAVRWRTACLITVLGDARFKRLPSPELCIP